MFRDRGNFDSPNKTPGGGGYRGGNNKRIGTGSNNIPVNRGDRERPPLQLGANKYNEQNGNNNNRRPFGGKPGGFRKPPPKQPQIPQKPKSMELKFSSKSTITSPAKQFRTKKDGLCSMFLISVEPGSKAYRYDVEIVAKGGKKEKSLSKGSDDGQKSLNRNLCYNILLAAHINTEGFGMEEGGEVVYDCKSVLYTSTPINLKSPVIEVKSGDINDEIVNDDVVEFVRMYCGNDDFAVSISPNQACPVLDISNIEQYKLKKTMFEEDRTVRTFLEMAITQSSINDNLYTPIGAGKLFEITEDVAEEVIPGIVIRCGIAKGVRVVQNYGDPKPALVMDMKMSPFYKAQPLIETILAIFGKKQQPTEADWKRIRSFIYNIRVYVRFNPQRTFSMGKLTDKPLYQLKGIHEGQKLAMDQIFERKQGLKLQYANFPGVIPNIVYPRGRAPEIFPLEELVILPDQRVPLDKMSKHLSDKLLKVSTVRPNERFAKIMHHAERMGVFDNAGAVLSAFGIRIDRETNQVVVGIRPCPRICYGEGHMVNVNADNAGWSQSAYQAQYIQTMDIGTWFVFCELKHASMVKKFIAKYIEVASSSGMKFLKDPIYMTYNGERGEKWSTKFESAIRNNVKMDFILLIDDKEEKSHELLKYYEALYKVLTQHITIERVEDVLKGKFETLKNIIAKTNCKNFGLNYVPIMEGVAAKFTLDSMKTLVIAYDVAHPPPVTSQERRYLRAKNLTVESFDPSVVGICANMASNPNAFVGDYFYQESRKEKVDSVQLLDSVSWILKMLAQNRGENHVRPRYVFVLRDGLSEGQHLMAFEEELNAIRSGFKDFDPEYKPKLVFVINTKRHYKKFFTLRDGVVENLLPGTVIAEKFVRTDLPEFFMQSHYPIKGVGKPVEYTVICDEIGVSQDELQGFLNALCYSHQIVNSAISLPEPVYQADELAKRGRNNYLTMKQMAPDNVQKGRDGLANCAELTRLLSYRYDTKNLVSTRFTA